MPNYLKYLLLIIGSSVLLFPFLGRVHLFDWDEINFAECAREMIVSKDYLRTQIDFLPFWEKPPFFIWLQVLSMKIFGIGAFAARFPNAMIGVATLTTLYYIGAKIYNEKVAFWWVLVYTCTWLPFFYFKSGIIDPTFNYFILLAIFQFYLLLTKDNKYRNAILFGLLLGIAVLTKGPVAILVVFLTILIFLLLTKSWKQIKLKYYFITAFCIFIPITTWLIIAIINYGTNYGRWFVLEFLQYQVRLFSTEDSDHGGPIYYHFVVLLIGCFPASVFLFNYWKKKQSGTVFFNYTFTKLAWIFFGVVLILFSIVKTKIVHYSSLCYFPITLLAALQIFYIHKKVININNFVKYFLGIMGLMISLIIIAIPIVGLNKDKLSPYIQDPFVVSCFTTSVYWGYAECCIGIIYFLVILYFIVKNNINFKYSVLILLIGQLFIIQIMLYHFVPKVENYTQGTAIAYFQSFKGKKVFLHPLGFKSYAYLFYGETTYTQMGIIDSNNKKNIYFADENNLLNATIDRDVYFICKIQDEKKYLVLPQLLEIGKKNGFVFFKRKFSTN